MLLELCLQTESFEYRNLDQCRPISDILLDFDNLIEKAYEDGDNVFKSDSIYEVEFFDSIELFKVLYCDEKESSISVDEVAFLRQIIDHIPTKENEYNNIADKIATMSCIVPSAFACFHKTGNTPLHILNAHGLTTARRYYLHYVKNEAEFVNCAPLCFPNIYFHPGVEHSLKQLSVHISVFIKEVIVHLSALNDRFPMLIANNQESLNVLLEVFSAQEQLAASMEGDVKEAKKRFTFTFLDCQGEEINIVCEPHTKLEKTGIKGDTKYRFDRIYFHPGRDDVENGKILVAHIGKHL